MAEKLTPQQEMAVKNRGGKLLVSAAAGSGKTKVLVDRLMDYILDPVDPANLDEFLIITYTKAAASELRGKIAAKLNERMAEQPENKHLQSQMQRLYLAKISTVHSFCGDILKEYAYKLDLPADFRVADENECRQLRDTVMARMLESAYEKAEEDPDFRAFVDAQGLGRDDRLVPEILLKVYDSARCHLDADGWLEDCVRHSNVEGLEDAGQTLWGKRLMDSLFHYLDLQIKAMENCARLAAEADDMEKPAALLEATVQQLRYLRQSESWDQVLMRKDIDFGTLRFSKKCDQELAEGIKAVRTACKKGLEKKLNAFSDESAQVLTDMAQTAHSVRGMVALARRFGKEYDRAKRSRRILDFGDLEHRMLDLLLGKGRSGPTQAAREIGRRFREIMVDEYQDSNAVQDAIFSALTQEKGNCFMVGDVKQSIYQFRLADPGIFLEKYNTYADAADAKGGEGRKVMLSANFRSGGSVLKSVNDVFSLCMSPEVGGLYYGEEEALREGIPHDSLGEPEVELLAVDVQESTYEEEPAVVAQRIAELLDGTHFVRDKEGLRPIKVDDICILLRSPGSVGGYYLEALGRLGIRASSGGGEDLLQTQEIATLRSLLQTISNPRQDIPLISILASPVFGFTADDLAEFRSKNKWCSVYDALLESHSPKAQKFLAVLQVLRREARLNTLAQLIEKIFTLTRMDSIFAAMAGGELKKDNLWAFHSLAYEYETGARRDLEQFLDHLTAMEEKGLVRSGEQTSAGAVTLMSIHKSKGLEFPVVFVCGLGREFNRESARAQVLCDQELGLGLSAVDQKNRLRYPTVAKRAIGAKVMADSLSEELRVLYVALTRARDRLIMTYASRNLQKDVAECALRMDLSPVELLAGEAVCPGQWVLMTALRRTEAGELFALGARPKETTLGDPVWKIAVVKAQESGAAGEEAVEVPKMPPEVLGQLERGLSFQYGHIPATLAPSKQTATQRKGRVKDAEAEEGTTPKHATRAWRRPSFAGGNATGADRGNAVHAVMEYIRYDQCRDEAAVQKELERLAQEGFITEQQAQLVEPQKIAAFFRTELGQKIQTGQTLREFKFSILDDGREFDPQLQEEKILLQGVVDCLMLEEDGITIVDFKTDMVTKETMAQRAVGYRAQVLTYAQAMERIFQRPVKKALLYFFQVGEFVEVE